MQQKMFLVNAETLIRTIGGDGFEQLPSVINFRVVGGMYSSITIFFLSQGDVV